MTELVRDFASFLSIATFVISLTTCLSFLG